MTFERYHYDIPTFQHQIGVIIRGMSADSGTANKITQQNAMLSIALQILYNCHLHSIMLSEVYGVIKTESLYIVSNNKTLYSAIS